MLRENLERVLKDYLKAKQEPLRDHPMGLFLRHSFPENLKSLMDNPRKYKFDGSAGQGNWAKCPWVAVFDTFITDSVQSGYYPVYAFRGDMKGVYLSLNQGVTEIRAKYKVDPKRVLQTRAQDFRHQLGNTPTRFREININLATESPSELAAFYEAGNIYARYYDRNNLPPENELVTDFSEIMKLYETLCDNENMPAGLHNKEEDEENVKILEDLTKLRIHKKIERNAELAKKAKKIHGYNCHACGFNFEVIYGKIGKDYIEAHHLIPISKLKGRLVEMEPKKDFAVLCSNCHSMIHKFDNPSDIRAFQYSTRISLSKISKSYSSID